MNDTTSPIGQAEASMLRVEAARYALLRRLSSAMRHELVMHLQPIGMVTEVLQRRLGAPVPDLAQVHDSVGKINNFSKAAVQSCLDVISWLAPEAGGTTPAQAGVHEIVELLRSNLSFRGFALQSQVQELPQPVSRGAMRMLLPAALLAMSDQGPAPADMVLSAQADDDTVRLHLRLVPKEGDAGPQSQLPYRTLAWQDVMAMARSEDVELTRASSEATLSFPILA